MRRPTTPSIPWYSRPAWRCRKTFWTITATTTSVPSRSTTGSKRKRLRIRRTPAAPQSSGWTIHSDLSSGSQSASPTPAATRSLSRPRERGESAGFWTPRIPRLPASPCPMPSVLLPRLNGAPRCIKPRPSHAWQARCQPAWTALSNRRRRPRSIGGTGSSARSRPRSQTITHGCAPIAASFTLVSTCLASAGKASASWWWPSIALDTISERQLGQFAGEVNALIEEHRPEKVHLLYFDTLINRHDVYSCGEQVVLMPVGGGGTEFAPIFEHIDQNGLNPHALVILTDLYGPVPDGSALPCHLGVYQSTSRPVWRNDLCRRGLKAAGHFPNTTQPGRPQSVRPCTYTSGQQRPPPTSGRKNALPGGGNHQQNDVARI